jgi:hypothetical protein
MNNNESIQFRQGAIVANPGGDVGYSAGTITRNTSGTQQSSTDFDSLNTAPTSGYTTGGGFGPPVVVGTTYVIQTSAGYYCKIKFTAVTPGVTVSFQYAIAAEPGVTNLTTS